MRHQSALAPGKWIGRAIAALLLMTIAVTAEAQVPFSLFDWLTDRGQTAFVGGRQRSSDNRRLGYNNYDNDANDPGPAAERFFFPFNRDLTAVGIVNPNTGPREVWVNNDDSIAAPGNQDPLQPRAIVTVGTPGAASGRARFVGNTWAIPPITDRENGAVGPPFSGNATQFYAFDYAYTPAIHDDFLVGGTPATSDDFNRLPISPTSTDQRDKDVLAAINARLFNATPTRAQWASGDLIAGRYRLTLYMVGNGVRINNAALPPSPGARRAFVRVSWQNTMANNGTTFNDAGINDTDNSRVYMVNLQQTQIELSGDFPSLGGVNNQLVVTLYTLTPDALNDPAYAKPPVITADTVKFSLRYIQPNLNTPLGSIASTGRILGPAVAASNFGVADTMPLIYFTRNENIPNPNDPTQLISVPVFYCIDNQRGDAPHPNGAPGQQIFSSDKVRWRFVGAPGGESGEGTASPLLANVRCRDGQIRPMVYFVTRASGGRIGHIYALDPLGDRVNQTTTAYWTYPTIRPLLAGFPADQYPAQFHDPNYKDSVPGAYATLPSFGADKPVDGASTFYYDGDIIKQPLNQNNYMVSPVSRIRDFQGAEASPLIMTDPADANGAQLLIVPNMNGRVYAFDAGGRGDYGIVNGQIAIGTTQRIWTWPRFNVDGYRYQPAVLASIIGNLSKRLDTYDERAKEAFPTTPSIDEGVGTIVVGTSDGVLYGLRAVRDTFKGLVNNTSIFEGRRAWQYPGSGLATLNGPISVAAIYRANAAPGNVAYFTSDNRRTPGGRVYAVTLPAPGAVLASEDVSPPTAPLAWVYPHTTNAPDPINGDENSASTPLGFRRSAPVVQRIANRDLVYALEGGGIVRALDAYPGNGLPNLVASSIATNSINDPGTAATTIEPPMSPIASRFFGNLLGVLPKTPAIFFADTVGAQWAIQATPVGNVLPALTEPLAFDSFNQPASGPRTAPILAGGVLYYGQAGADSFGQLEAYAFGLGPDGRGGTGGIGAGNPIQAGDGSVTVDIRVLDLYRKVNESNFMLDPLNAVNQARAQSPGRKTDGTRYNNAVVEIPGNVAAGSTAYAAEWGDSLYVAAWGVYHAKPGDINRQSYGAGGPTIDVTITIQQPTTGGVRPRPTIVRVPAVLSVAGPNGNQLWPDDFGISPGDHNGLTIYGTDPDNPAAAAGPRTGPAQGVYPWVAVIRVPNPGIDIVPDVNTPYTPGSEGYRITARAEIRQSVIVLDGNGVPQPATEKRDISRILSLGQHSWFGKSQSLQQTVEGEERRLMIAHPFAVTVRSFTNITDMTGQGIPNIIGWGPDLSTLSEAGRREMLGNGNRVSNPFTGGALIKSLFAPLGLVPDSTSQQYSVQNNLGNPVAGLYITDRSNMWLRGKPVNIKAVTRPYRWHGGFSSVLNPLPWEQMPTDVLDSADYPNIAQDAFTLINQDGTNLVDVADNVGSPLIPASGNPNDPTTRVLHPTLITMTVRVPRYQPANVNYGVDSKYGYGSPYRDISGRLLGTNVGDNLSGDPIVGPLTLANGLPNLNANNRGNIFPAAGYVTDMIFRSTNGQQNPPREGLPTSQAFRLMETGLSVPPTVKMRVTEQTIDFGKQPHGTGYSDFIGPNQFRAPFAPSPSVFWAGPNSSPWDFLFREFTMINDSNVNLVAPRIAKLIGEPGAAFNAPSLSANPPNGFTTSARLLSDQINDQTVNPIFASPFPGTGVGNIGIVSSFDHLSSTSNNNPLFREASLWPVQNPFVTAAGVAAAGLPTANDLPNGILGWTAANSQPYPVVIKSLPGDTQGVVATVPAVPRNANFGAIPSLTPQKPKIGLAIPMGTPSGTYANPILVFEDNTPIQWRGWLEKSRNQGVANLGVSRDGILNVNPLVGLPVVQSPPVETFTDPAMTLRVTVRESRLTQGVTPGVLPQIDSPLNPNAADPALWKFLPGGANLLPAPILVPGTGNIAQRIALYWATNRQPNGVASANSPWTLAYSLLAAPNDGVSGADFNFAQPGSAAGAVNARWWSAPQPFKGLTPGNAAAGPEYLFPSTLAEAQAAAANGARPPFQTGERALQTERHASPAVTPYDPTIANDNLIYLFWQATIDKLRTSGVQTVQVPESRTFYSRLVNGVPNGPTYSFLNDPALTKLSPKPLIARIPGGQRFMYLFWHAGNQSQTTLYYNVNTDAAFSPTAWAQDVKLPTPGALVWQSDPQPVYRSQATVYDPLTDQLTLVNNIIDVVYTGVLKNRQSVEVLLSRYRIRTAVGPNGEPVGSLELLSLPVVTREKMTRVGRTNNYISRDASWVYGTDPNGNGVIRVELLANEPQNPDPANAVLLNRRGNGSPSRGRLDTASGLVYFDSALGGQMTVDTRSGTVSFPNIQPGNKDAVLVTYTPQVMRLTTARDDTNLDRFAGFGNVGAADRAFRLSPTVTQTGNASNPYVVIDRYTNPRRTLTAPAVLFSNAGQVLGPNATVPIDRMWVIYRKTDLNGADKAALYYKTLRLAVRLPRAVAISPNNQIAGLTVGGARGPYEVDWVRGRIYFTQADEGNVVTVQYTMAEKNNPPRASGNLTYRVGWSDELEGGAEEEPNFTLYRTTAEAILPMDTKINEGQVSGFKDPYQDKLWLFWSSTRAATTDLYYQTIAPQFYPTASNQR